MDTVDRLARDVPELLDDAPCGFVSFRDDGTIVVANATLARLLDLEPAELHGRSVEAILTVPARIFYQTHFFPLLKLEGKAEEIYLTLQSRTGQHVHVLVTAARRERNGEARNDCVFLPIHERQKYERELLRAKKAAEEASRSKSRFLSMMSHDLRTPLNAILGYSGLLLEGIRGEITEPQARDLRRMRDAGKYLLGLLDDILNFARADANEMTLHIERVPLSPLLAEAEALLAPRFQELRLEYRREACRSELFVRADRDRLKQIVLNLLTNAAKFTPSPGRVSVECPVADERVLLRVADTGRGIPPEFLTHIFEPFVQVEAADAKNQHGVGLGLAISRTLARGMGADITVESEVGKGSVFTVSLEAS